MPRHVLFQGTIFIIAAGLILLEGCGQPSGDTGLTTGGSTGDSGVSTSTGSEGTTAEPQCSGESATSTQGAPPPWSDDSCPEHSVADSCCCFEPAGTSLVNVCEQQFPCEEIIFLCDWDDVNPCAYEKLVTPCEAAVDCALLALASGKPGTIRWRVGRENGGEYGELHAVGDGTGFSFRHLQDDLNCETDALTRRALAAPDFFSDCTSGSTVLQRFNCIRGAFVGAPIETCFDSTSCSLP